MKRVLSLVLALVLVLGMMPSFAASASGAEELYSNGFITGANGDLMVEKSLTRAEMAVILSELFGVKEEAMNFAVPANFTDVNDHWAASYIAYGQEAGWFGGYPDGTYKPEGVVSGNELASFVLNALGYQGDYTFAEALEVAATMGIEVPSKAILTRGDAFGSIWTTVNTPAKGDTVALGVKLGKLEPVVVVPTDLEVVSVTADNLVQVAIEFNQKVDESTAEDVDNYSFDDSATKDVIDASLQDDGMTVVLTLGTLPSTIGAMGQQDTDVLTVENVLTADESVEIDSTDVDVTWLDKTLPTVLDAEVVGVSTIKVTFSEPMDSSATLSTLKGYFEVNDGKYYIKNVTFQKNDSEVMVVLYSKLKTGELPFEVKTKAKDYAGFTAIGKTFTLDVVEDTTAPTVVGYTDADENEVTLIWSEDIELTSSSVAASEFYHTNSKNTVDAALTSAKIDGNEMTLDFSTNELPEGTAYVYVLEDAVQDLWNNENVQQMIEVEVNYDNTDPVLTEIEVDAEDVLILSFDEEMDTTTVDKSDFTVLDSDGDEYDVNIKSFKWNTDKDELTITFTEDLDGGDYTLVTEEIEDTAGNEMAATTIAFTVTDLTAPVLSASEITVTYYVDGTDATLKVDFPEAMATSGEYSVTDLAKYVLNDGGVTVAVEDIDDVEIASVDDGTAVEITFDTSDQAIVTGTDTLSIARVADEAGNYSAEVSVTGLPIGAAGNIAVSEVVLTGEYIVEVTFDDEVSDFDANDIIFSTTSGGTALDIDSVTTELDDDGNTVATYTLADTSFNGFAFDGTDAFYRTVAAPASENRYGETLAVVAAGSTADDELAPALAVVVISGDDEDDVMSTTNTGAIGSTTSVSSIRLTFEEAIDSSYVSFSSFEVEDYDILNVTVASNVITIYFEDEYFAAEVGTNVSLVADIYDMNGNALEAGDLNTESTY